MADFEKEEFWKALNGMRESMREAHEQSMAREQQLAAERQQAAAERAEWDKQAAAERAERAERDRQAAQREKRADERQEALAQSVELLTHDVHDLIARMARNDFDMQQHKESLRQDAENIRALVRIAEIHERTSLEGDEEP